MAKSDPIDVRLDSDLAAAAKAKLGPEVQGSPFPEGGRVFANLRDWLDAGPAQPLRPKTTKGQR